MKYEVFVTQLYLTLCNPMDCSLPGSSVHRISQARILEWVVILSPGNLPNPGIKPGSPALQADTSLCEPPRKPIYIYIRNYSQLKPLII